ncbi:MAG: hypothetical protein PHR77_12475 [Kiritimatiellae bacterium]|nr:hypothetical protein [Kiritimatiellia bacterium]MDD5520877.1 hypothetical protein [Kiritimatiellia bacterium]
MKQYLITVSLICMVTGALAQTLEVDPAQESWNTPGQASMPPPPPQVQSVPDGCDAAYFYKSLQPHGTWIEINPLGIVWRPHVAIKDTTWRPYYSGGRWVWVNNVWAWSSDYEWGWAPFHYGRWVMSTGLGWVWIPGKEWSPAWVIWDQTPTQFGWAPMPPESSAYIGIGSTTGSGFSWGFQFSLTRDHYVYTPCSSFREVIVVNEPAYRYYNYGYYGHYGHYNNSCDGNRHDHHERPACDVRREPTAVHTPEPSRRTSAMQQIVTRTTLPVVNVSRPIQQVTPQRPASEVRREPTVVRTPEPSRRTSAMQQIVRHTAPAVPSVSRQVQQAAPRVNVTPPSRITAPRISAGNANRASSSSDRRSSRLSDIVSRSRK